MFEFSSKYIFERNRNYENIYKIRSQKIEGIENFVTNLSVNNNDISTKENQCPLVVKLLKSKVSVLEK